MNHYLDVQGQIHSEVMRHAETELLRAWSKFAVEAIAKSCDIPAYIVAEVAQEVWRLTQEHPRGTPIAADNILPLGLTLAHPEDSKQVICHLAQKAADNYLGREQELEMTIPAMNFRMRLPV